MAAFDNYEYNQPIVEKITFYADHAQYRNKLFTFKIVNYFAAYNLLIHFVQSGNHIRSCYIKGYQLDRDEAKPFQQTVSQEFISVLNSTFSTDFAKFYLSLE